MDEVLIPTHNGKLSIREKDKDYEVIYFIYNLKDEIFEMEELMIIDKNFVNDQIKNIVG
jgi:hypothetical protein